MRVLLVAAAVLLSQAQRRRIRRVPIERMPVSWEQFFIRLISIHHHSTHAFTRLHSCECCVTHVFDVSTCMSSRFSLTIRRITLYSLESDALFLLFRSCLFQTSFTPLKGSYLIDLILTISTRFFFFN